MSQIPEITTTIRLPEVTARMVEILLTRDAEIRDLVEQELRTKLTNEFVAKIVAEQFERNAEAVIGRLVQSAVDKFVVGGPEHQGIMFDVQAAVRNAIINQNAALEYRKAHHALTVENTALRKQVERLTEILVSLTGGGRAPDHEAPDEGHDVLHPEN